MRLQLRPWNLKGWEKARLTVRDSQESSSGQARPDQESMPDGFYCFLEWGWKVGLSRGPKCEAFPSGIAFPSRFLWEIKGLGVQWVELVVERHLLDGAVGGRSQTLPHLRHPGPEL